MEMLVLTHPKIKKGELIWSDEEISIPAAHVERIFHRVPEPILKAFLAGYVKFPGFRNPHKVPRPILFRSLSNEPRPYLFSGIIWSYMQDLLLELDGARVRDVRRDLAQYVAMYGEDIMHLALLVHKRPGVRKLVAELPKAVEATTTPNTKAEPEVAAANAQATAANAQATADAPATLAAAAEAPSIPDDPIRAEPIAAADIGSDAIPPDTDDAESTVAADAESMVAAAGRIPAADPEAEREAEPTSAEAAPAIRGSFDTSGPSPADTSSLGLDHSNCQRTVSRLQRELEQKDSRIQAERRQNGKLSEDIGQLRDALQQRDKALEDLIAKHERLQAKARAYEQQAAEHARLAEWEARLRARDEALIKLFGTNHSNLREAVVSADARAHDLEATFTVLAMVLEQAQQLRRTALEKAPTSDEISLDRCIAAVSKYIEQCGRDAAAVATNAELDLTARTGAALALQRHLAAVEHLTQLTPGDATVPLGDRSTAINQLIAGLRTAEEIEFSLTGTVFYEGPHAWLRTEEHSLGLPSLLTEAEQLLTGDEVQLRVAHSPDALFAWEASVLRRVERHEVNDSLRLDDAGFWVQTPEGARLDVSLVEMLRSGIQPDWPVQVQAPEVPLGAAEPVYVRLAKALPMPNVRRPSPGAARHTRRRMARLAATTAAQGIASGAVAHGLTVPGSTVPEATVHEATVHEATVHGSAVHQSVAPESLAPRLFRGQTVLIAGGDGRQGDYLDVIRQMGGQATWQSGFADFARVSDRTAKSDIVIVITGRTSHAVSQAAAAQARRCDAQIAHFNGLGRSSFMRFLLETFDDSWSDEAVG